MARAYHIDLRERVVEYARRGNSYKSTAEFFKISKTTVYEWVKRSRKNCLEYTIKERKPRKLNTDNLLIYINNNPDKTIKEVSLEFKVSTYAIWSAFKKLKITRKKNDTLFRKRRKAKR